MKAEGSVKTEHILDAAIKRFSYFGINKTTLTEIAEDLSISKPLLFYYFHDKNSLIAAVAGKIINEFLEALETAFAAAGSVEEGLQSLVEIKREHFKKFFLLAIQGDSADFHKDSSAIHELYQQARKRTTAIISTLLQKGIQERVLKPTDTEKTSQLLLETLAAFEYCMKGRTAVPEMIDIDEMFNKQQAVVNIFLNGLKSSEWKN